MGRNSAGSFSDTPPCQKGHAQQARKEGEPARIGEKGRLPPQMGEYNIKSQRPFEGKGSEHRFTVGKRRVGSIWETLI